MAITKKQIRLCFDQWFYTLPQVCAIESPWCYLCLASLIDYMSAAAYPHLGSQRDRYIAFIENYYPAKYRKFKYKGGNTDLPLQMYYILRNGLVHSFSLFPDQKGRINGGRERSIVLVHRSNAAERRHLSEFSSPSAKDAALFVAEDFLSDTTRAAYKMLNKAKKGSALWQSVTKRFMDHPPIQWRS